MAEDYKIELKLCYGVELFEYLKQPLIWSEIIEHLTKWKSEIKELPDIDFDLYPEETFHEIKELKPSIFSKLFDNDEIFNEIILNLFPKKKTLKLLYNYFLTKDKEIYQTLASKLLSRIES